VNDRLYRSPTDRVIAGVAGGMAVWLNLDPSLVRVGWVLLAIFSGGIFILVYIVMMIVVPLPPPGWVPQRPPATAADWGGGWSGGGQTAPGTGQPGAADGGPSEAGGWSSPPPGPGAAPGPWSSPPPSTTGRSAADGGRGAGIVLGAVLIVIGAWFLVGRYIHIDWGAVWPIVVVLLGIGLIAAAIRRGPSGGNG